MNVGDYPAGITASGNYIYVTNVYSKTVTVINITTNIVVSTVKMVSPRIGYGQFICPLPVLRPPVLPYAEFRSRSLLCVQFMDLSKKQLEH